MPLKPRPTFKEIAGLSKKAFLSLMTPLIIFPELVTYLPNMLIGG